MWNVILFLNNKTIYDNLQKCLRHKMLRSVVFDKSITNQIVSKLELRKNYKIKDILMQALL